MNEELSQLGKDLRAIREEIIAEERDNTPKPAESGPLDLAPIEARLNQYVRNRFFAPGPINEDAAALIVEVKRLSGNIGLLIQKWSFHSPHTRDTLKAKDVLAALQDALVSENYYAGEEE